LFIKKLVLQGYKIHVAGDRLHIFGVTNHGFINHKSLINLLQSSKFTISSNENSYTLFAIDCINCNVKILVDSRIKIKKTPNSSGFIAHDFRRIFYH
jgi:DNA-directed RNA polymerase subunit RPC12/RpoP